MRSAKQLRALAAPATSRPRPRNPEHQAKSFARQYGSLDRVRWVKTLPCAACCVEGWSENAHLLGNDGARRRGPYDTIGPLCGNRFTTVGCHTLYDEHEEQFDAMYPTFDPVAVAAQTEVGWQASAEAMAGAW